MAPRKRQAIRAIPVVRDSPKRKKSQVTIKPKSKPSMVKAAKSITTARPAAYLRTRQLPVTGAPVRSERKTVGKPSVEKTTVVRTVKTTVVKTISKQKSSPKAKPVINGSAYRSKAPSLTGRTSNVAPRIAKQKSYKKKAKARGR